MTGIFPYIEAVVWFVGHCMTMSITVHRINAKRLYSV